MIVKLNIEALIEVEQISDVNDDSIGGGLWQWIAEGEGLDIQELSSTVAPAQQVNL